MILTTANMISFTMAVATVQIASVVAIQEGYTTLGLIVFLAATIGGIYLLIIKPRFFGYEKID